MRNMHEANRRHWDRSAAGWRQLRDQDQLWRRIPEEPSLAFEGETLHMIQEFMVGLKGKRVCV